LRVKASEYRPGKGAIKACARQRRALAGWSGREFTAAGGLIVAAGRLQPVFALLNWLRKECFMTRIEPLAPDDFPAALQPVLDFARDTMGFTPNDVLTMARWPALLQAMAPMVGVIFSPGSVSMELKRFVATITSAAAGCQYCVAHNVHGMQQDGVAADKQAAIWEFDTSPLFSTAERAALVYARDAGQSPAAVTDASFALLQAHFDAQQILEITAVIALFGFLNRWNAGLGTTLEDQPLQFARSSLDEAVWSAGVHAPAGTTD
jgi:uncharacterized peroxidase-related enzyme